MGMTVHDTFLSKSSKGKLPLIFTPFKMTKDKQGKGLKRLKRLCINIVKASWGTISQKGSKLTPMLLPRGIL